MFAENAPRVATLRYPGKPNHEISSGSILYLAESANSFLGEISDDASITAIARTNLDSDRRSAVVELVGEGWLKIGATEAQLIRIRNLFRSLLFNARDIDTVGKLRQALADKKNKPIARIEGISGLGEGFLEIATKKHLRVVQPGLNRGNNLPSPRMLTVVK